MHSSLASLELLTAVAADSPVEHAGAQGLLLNQQRAKLALLS